MHVAFQVSRYLLLNELFFLLYVLSILIKNELATCYTYMGLLLGCQCNCPGGCNHFMPIPYCCKSCNFQLSSGARKFVLNTVLFFTFIFIICHNLILEAVIYFSLHEYPVDGEKSVERTSLKVWLFFTANKI